MIVLQVAVGVEVAQVRVVAHWHLACCVVAVLQLEAGVGVYVDVVVDALTSLKVVLHTHEHVKSSIRLGLTILNALGFLLIGRAQTEFNAVLVALLEQQAGECMLLE